MGLAVVLDLGDDDVDPRAHLAQGAGDGVGQVGIGLADHADEHALAGLGGAIPDEAGGRPTHLILGDDPAGDLEHIGELCHPADATLRPGLRGSSCRLVGGAAHAVTSRSMG